MDELAIVWYRLLITLGSLLFLPKMLEKISLIPPITALKLMGIGVVVAAHWLMFYGAINASNASIALCGFSSAAFFASIIEPLYLKRKFRIHELILGLIVIGGFTIIAESVQQYLLGLSMAIFSGLLSALFGVLNKSYANTFDAFTITFVEFIGGLCFLTLLAPIYIENPLDAFIPPSWLSVVGLFILALLCTTYAYTIVLKALKHVSAFAASMTINLEPVYGIILAALIYQENKDLNLRFYIGATIITACVFIHPWLSKKLDQDPKPHN